VPPVVPGVPMVDDPVEEPVVPEPVEDVPPPLELPVVL
jgi:hypothetical protein